MRSLPSASAPAPARSASPSSPSPPRRRSPSSRARRPRHRAPPCEAARRSSRGLRPRRPALPAAADGRFAQMPIRLWGTIAAPAAARAAPDRADRPRRPRRQLPDRGREFDTWPCWNVEQRNDLGFRYLVRALARAGFVAIAMDTNAAYTGGWGELPNKEKLRFGQVLDSTLAELTRANAVAQTRFAIPLQGRLDLTRVGMLGHSRGGMNILRWGNAKRPQAVFLVAPFFDAARGSRTRRRRSSSARATSTRAGPAPGT